MSVTRGALCGAGDRWAQDGICFGRLGSETEWGTGLIGRFDPPRGDR